ncbi:MAG: PKD domain-containing protein [Bacteroidetes bacterium]|nr:PKD domain-containing protein [Bacteroidota bacterium]
MHKFKHFIYLFILCSCISYKINAQSITATPSVGCAPLVGVQYTGLSGASNIQWAFGDGTFSNLNNPTHTFSSPGNFVTTYTAMVSGSPTTKTLNITVYGKPTPNFSVNISKGCVPLTVSFTDQSINSGGSLAPQWQWSFGDGGVSNVQNPNYPYTIPGTFNVTLIYKDGHGCDSAITKTGLIKVSVKPTVIITTSPTVVSACVAPFTATFSGSNSTSNSTTGSTSLTYNWNLNGTTSNAVNPPPITFTTTGSFPVTLTCTDNNSCSDTRTVTVNVSNPAVKASVKNFACYNANFTVRDTSASNVTQWNFGDGTPVQAVFPPNNLTHVYTSTGIFTITATTFLGTCSSVKTYTVNVEKVTANFTSAPPFSCTSPLVVNYNNTSIGATSYTWSFSGSTATSTLTSPTHTFTQGSLNPFTIFQPQPVSATLIVMSPGGCTDMITKTLDTLQRPTAFFYSDVIGGCNPLTVTFTDSSHSTKPIVNYSWNFGDGSPVNSSATNTLVTHTFTTPGVYYVTLSIQNTLGCRDTSFKWPIHVAMPPHTSFSFSPSVVCPYEPVSITNLTPLADSVNHWHLSSDAGFYSHCISDANPSWQFTHTGNHPLTLSAYSFGCKHDTTVPTGVLVKGPIVSGRFFTRCDSVFKVKFNLLLQDAAFAEIRYGDGQRDTVYASGSHTIYHTYATTGDYNVILKGENSATGCLPNYDTLKVKVRNIKSVITSQAITCAGVPTSYSAASSQDVDGVCGVGYIWLFGNLPPVITDNSSTSYALPAGTQSIALVVKDVNGCRDTSRTTILVSYVNANASLTNTIGCVPSFSLTGTQSATSNTTITNYNWNFGDGSPSVNSAVASHTYTSANPPFTVYTITLTVTNINGCVDSKYFPVTMNAPYAPNIIPSSSQLCAGKTVSLSTTAAGVNTYTWNYGDGSPVQVTTAMNVTHPYLVGGNYNVTLVSADAAGCKASSTPYAIQVQNYPNAIISYTNQNNPGKQNACAGSTVLFSDNSINPYVPQTRNWNFGTGSGPVVGNQTVGTAYTTAGVYTVTLINCTPFGCCDTTKQNIKVYSATADFIIDKLAICKGEAIKYTIKDSTNVFVWGWDFGDGTDYNISAQSPISHTYNYHPPGGTTNVSLTYYSADSACKYSVVKPINIYQVVADFNRNSETSTIKLLSDTAHCIGITDIFTNQSLNANTYHWDFGDGGTSSSNTPSYLYNAPGNYTVSLSIADNIHGCKDTIRKSMLIFPVPLLSLNGRDTCQNKPTQLTASGGVTYTWSPSFGLSNPNSASPIATLSTTTLFSVTANNSYGCVGTNTLLITIQEPPLPISWDTSIVIGQTAVLPGYAGAGFTYSWSPVDYLSCVTCPLPVASPTVEYVYTVNVKDTHGCFERVNTYTVYIENKSSVDVPTAFTPNGDGINDLINVAGWGIKKLNYFKVFNRWGELIYETTDLASGWDGYYKGVPQNMETYVYQAEVETYTDSAPINKTGYFKLLR